MDMKVVVVLFFCVVVGYLLVQEQTQESFSTVSPPSLTAIPQLNVIPRVSVYNTSDQPNNFYIRDNSNGRFLYLAPDGRLQYDTLAATPFTINGGSLIPVNRNVCLGKSGNLSQGGGIGVFPINDAKCTSDRTSRFEVNNGRVVASANKNLMLGNISNLPRYTNSAETVQNVPCIRTQSNMQSNVIPRVSVYTIADQPNNFFIRDNSNGKFLYLSPEGQLLYEALIATPFTIRGKNLVPVNAEGCLAKSRYLSQGDGISIFPLNDWKCTSDKTSQFEIQDGRLLASANKKLMFGSINNSPKYMNSGETVSQNIPCIMQPPTYVVIKPPYVFPYVYKRQWISVKNAYKNPPINDDIDYDIVEENKRNQKPLDEMKEVLDNFRRDYLQMDYLNRRANREAFLEYLRKSEQEKSFVEVGGHQYQEYLCGFLRACLTVSVETDKNVLSMFVPWLKTIATNNYNNFQTGKEDITRWDVPKNNAVLLRYKNILYLTALTNDTYLRKYIYEQLSRWMMVRRKREEVGSIERSADTDWKFAFVGDIDRRTRSLNYTNGALTHLKDIIAFLASFGFNVDNNVMLLNECIKTWNEDRKAGGILYARLGGGDQIRIPDKDINPLDLQLVKKLNFVEVINGAFN